MYLVSLVGMVLLICSITANAQANTKTLFRYVNSAGVTVVDSAIPPQYVAQGYQIISLSGKVVKTVPAALTPEQAKAREIEEKQRLRREQEDYQLRRSYSNLDDIEAAKVRNLQMLESSIAILKRNREIAERQLLAARTSATNIERSAKVAPAPLLSSIESYEKEILNLDGLLIERRAEHAAVAAKFEADKQRFIELMQGDAAY